MFVATVVERDVVSECGVVEVFGVVCGRRSRAVAGAGKVEER